MAEIHEAVELGDLERVKAILAADPDKLHAINEEPPHQQPLHSAINNGESNIAIFLIGMGADIHAFDSYRFSPIHQAAWYDHPDLVELLAEKGADLNSRGEHDWTSLHMAGQNGCARAAKALLDNGADYTVLTRGVSPLHQAVFSREPEGVDVARVLIEFGAPLDLNSALGLGDVDAVRNTFECDPNAVQNAPFPKECLRNAIDAIRFKLIGAYRAPKEEQIRICEANLDLLELPLKHGALNVLASEGLTVFQAMGTTGFDVFADSKQYRELLNKYGCRE